ncbi:hypothetical protein Tco_0791681 [Tanacetum coccineum]
MDVKENGNSFKPAAQTTTNANGTSTSLIPGPVTTEEKAQKKNDVKARSMLLMALPNEHLMTFNQYKDAKTLFAAIQTRFGGNEATKKTQKTLLKQISLPSEWNTHVVVWRNKPDLDTMSFDDLYNNFKIVEQEVKGTASSSSSSISPASTQVSTASTQVSTANLSDATVYAFLASQPNGSQFVYEDLEQIHEDDLEEIDLNTQTDIGPMIAERNRNQVKFRKNLALMAFSDSEEFQQPEFEGYGPKTSKSVSKDISNEADYNYHQKEKVVSGNNYTRVNYNYSAKKAHPSAHKNIVPRAGHLQKEDQGYVDSRCSRYMTGNMSYLSDFKEFDGGYVKFRGRAKGGKITGKGTLKTVKLDFEDVYYVKEL